MSHPLRLLFALSLALAVASCSARTDPPLGRAAGSPLRDTHENLNTVLWMQTAVEYDMLTEGIYARARQLLDDGLQKARTSPTWTADPDQTGDLSSLPPAVIMDLDETVLDNSPYEAEQILRHAGAFDPGLWTQWTERREARAIAGAIGFIDHARTKGAHVFFITGRTAEEESATVANLHALGLSVTPDDILTTGEGEWTGGKRDKRFRRAFIAARHRILLMVGDDLRDFVAADGLSPEERTRLARQFEPYWRDRWIVLPNPIYGGWEASVRQGVQSSADADVLAYKRSLLRSFRD